MQELEVKFCGGVTPVGALSSFPHVCEELPREVLCSVARAAHSFWKLSVN